MVMASCPACGANVPIDDTTGVSERLRCPECGALLEYTGNSPFPVEWIKEGWRLEYPSENFPTRTIRLKRRTKAQREVAPLSRRRQ